MPRFSSTSRCSVCGKEVSQSGPARQWVHENEFYAKADHPAEPAGKNYLTSKKTPEAKTPGRGAAKQAGAVKPKSAASGEGNRPRTLAELRRRLREGTSEVPADDSAARRRRIAALEAGETDTEPTPTELAARRLRMLRQADRDADPS